MEQTLPEAIKNNLPEDVTLVSKYSRGGATRENLFPSDRQGSLDADLLRKLGLTTQRINDQDALFFYQLLLPMVDPKRSGIVDDPRHAYYTIKNQLTNKYALLDRNLDGAYGHQWKPTPPMEHLIFDLV